MVIKRHLLLLGEVASNVIITTTAADESVHRQQRGSKIALGEVEDSSSNYTHEAHINLTQEQKFSSRCSMPRARARAKKNRAHRRRQSFKEKHEDTL